MELVGAAAGTHPGSALASTRRAVLLRTDAFGWHFTQRPAVGAGSNDR